MDKLDHQIIQELRKDGRKPFSTIAKKLGVSTQTITRRYHDMKTNGSIRLSAITISLEKIGYTGTAHMLITAKPNASSTQIVNQLSKTPNIITANRTIGSYDAYAVLAFRDINDLYENIIKIRGLPHIQRIDVSFALRGIKDFPPKLKRKNLLENEEDTITK
jgi:Lrp/AsnC family transcriptional regulator for asnA, asnC and gidA